jgi:hypothetical protein
MAIALRLKSQVTLGIGEIDDTGLAELWRLFEIGGHLGAQDSIVESLWLCEHSAGRADRASAMLTDYLLVRRRELVHPESSLRSTTAHDKAWQLGDPLLNRLRHKA